VEFNNYFFTKVTAFQTNKLSKINTFYPNMDKINGDGNGDMSHNPNRMQMCKNCTKAMMITDHQSLESLIISDQH